MIRLNPAFGADLSDVFKEDAQILQSYSVIISIFNQIPSIPIEIDLERKKPYSRYVPLLHWEDSGKGQVVTNYHTVTANTNDHHFLDAISLRKRFLSRVNPYRKVLPFLPPIALRDNHIQFHPFQRFFRSE